MSIPLNEWVKAAREAKGITQEQLGNVLNITKATVSAWENGRNKPSFEQVILISNLTEYPIPQTGYQPSVINNHTIEQTYQQKLKALINQHSGKHKLSQLTHFTSDEINRWLSEQDSSYASQQSAISSASMREIEKQLGLPYAWFDQPEEHHHQQLPNQPQHNHFIQLRLLNINNMTGFNPSLHFRSETVRMIEVSEAWAHEHFGHNLNNIAIITASGDAMRPTFNHNDLLFIDTSIDHYMSTGVYAFISPSGFRVKRLQMLVNNDINIISDNDHYETEVIKQQDLNNMIIFGKIIATCKLNKI